MVRNVFMNGKISTLLVFEDTAEDVFFNPVLETLRDQADRIEVLEEQNRMLAQQEALLTHLLEITIQTGELMGRSLETLERMRACEADRTHTIESEEPLS